MTSKGQGPVAILRGRSGGRLETPSSERFGLNLGVPAADLSIAIVQTPRGETHAILIVSTDRGEMVLDSLSPSVQPWRKVHYHWTKRQIPGQPLSWVSL